ncbi:ABC transporter substrate-binding protein [Aureimonas fodinaquatilis]|uniref:ABC transporter substrate-binding protein n=2 Tax=Aureimonas fodinaquatilis TaxID=2565783 RepID=A0A5B0DY41_9HYPH|nr:ABC transporter substrate-binding protein [Aureimonas fodinaquatilis]
MPSTSIAQESVRIGLATQAWWPTVVAEVASRQGLFEKEGLSAELTVYQSGGETFTALAAGAADVISIQPSIVATGRNKGVASKIVGLGSTANYGWNLIVPTDSDIQSVADLDGKNVGITASGSLSDFLALWTVKEHDVTFTSIPLGGAGLVPNLISGNVDAAVVFSPLSFQIIESGDGRSILDYGGAIPEHLNSGWAASDTFIENNGPVLQKTLNALYGGVAWLQANEDEAIDLLVELNQIDREVAARDYAEQFTKLSAEGVPTVEGAQAALDLAVIGGMTDLAPAADIVEERFPPVPTQP